MPTITSVSIDHVCVHPNDSESRRKTHPFAQTWQRGPGSVLCRRCIQPAQAGGRREGRFSRPPTCFPLASAPLGLWPRGLCSQRPPYDVWGAGCRTGGRSYCPTLSAGLAAQEGSNRKEMGWKPAIDLLSEIFPPCREGRCVPASRQKREWCYYPLFLQLQFQLPLSVSTRLLEWPCSTLSHSKAVVPSVPCCQPGTRQGSPIQTIKMCREAGPETTKIALGHRPRQRLPTPAGACAPSTITITITGASAGEGGPEASCPPARGATARLSESADACSNAGSPPIM